MLRKVLFTSLALVSCDLAQAQDVDVRSRAKTQSDTSVGVGSDGSVSVQTRSKSQSETSVTVGTPAPVASQPQREPRSMREPAPRPQAMGQPPAVPEGAVIILDGMDAPPAAAARPRPPLPCKQKVEAVSDQLRITIVNNYCTVKISIQKLWREGGKTHVQFEADNAKGGQQAALRMVEQWKDQSGRAVADAIDEQRISIAKGGNTIFSVTGPTPAAITGTITLYR